MPKNQTWREYATPIIARVLRETSGQDEKAVKAALRDAYPFGEREYHPYKIWCDEVKRQRRLGKYARPSAHLPVNRRPTGTGTLF